jgi:hypothetical protein
MSFVMPEIVVQRVIQKGIKELRQNPDAFDQIFGQFLSQEMNADYGQKYINKVREWFFNTKVPVVQAWALNAQRFPCFSIHLASEQEDETKAAVGDFYGDAEDNTVATGVFTVHVDIGIHGSKDNDSVLWMYYIMAYIMFKQKRTAERLGIQLHTWQATDHQRVDAKLAENIWTRWVRFRCTTQNWLEDLPFTEVEDVETNVTPGQIGDGLDDLG